MSSKSGTKKRSSELAGLMDDDSLSRRPTRIKADTSAAEMLSLLQSLSAKLDAQERKADKKHKKAVECNEQLKDELAQMRSELKDEMEGVHSDLGDEIEKLEAALEVLQQPVDAVKQLVITKRKRKRDSSSSTRALFFFV